MTGADAARIGVAVLAAGASTRLGRPKQLVSWRGSTLLRHAAQVALDAGLGPVLVLLGAEAERCAPALEGLAVHVIVCDGWREGVGATIRAAAEAASAFTPPVDALILTTCDQPAVGPGHLRRLADAYRNGGARLVGSAYTGIVGIPALFDRSSFPSLASLRGDQGAKSVLSAGGAGLAAVPCPEAALDVDTESDTLAFL